MKTYRAEYQNLTLWVEGEHTTWRHNVHDPAIDEAGVMLFGSAFGAATSTNEIHADPNAAKEAACAEATRRRHPMGECGCDEASILWREAPNVS